MDIFPFFPPGKNLVKAWFCIARFQFILFKVSCMQKSIMPESDRPKFNKMKNRIKRPLQQKQRHKKSLWQMKLLHWPVYLDWCPSLVRIKRDWQETLTGQQWAKTRLEVRQPNIGILGVNQSNIASIIYHNDDKIYWISNGAIPVMT